MDYAELGLKCGLEIHQQLNTHKLFCNCPSKLRTDRANQTVRRELRPLAGETGKIDVAALYEASKRMKYTYEVYDKTTCLVELDEAPPLEVNEEALETCLTIAKILNCKVPDVLEVMRKTVLDGSNTTGFQRTILVGTHGYIETPNGKVSIDTVCLEEDSARRVSEAKNSVTYRLDRLGIPLIEIATSPDIRTPEQARDVAKALGDILRSTSKVMRGIGTIRQDLNVSIKGGARIELKGVQDLAQIPDFVREEVRRQKWMVNSGKKVLPEVRNVLPDSKSKFLRPMPGAARMYPETDHPFIDIPRARLSKIKLPESLDAKKDRYLRLGLSKDLTEQLVSSEFSTVFDDLVKKYKKVQPTLVAATLLSTTKDVRRKLGQEEGVFSEEHFYTIFEKLSKDELSKDAVPDVLMDVAKGGVLSKNLARYKKLSKIELKKYVDDIRKKNPKLKGGALMGRVMSELKGRADGREIMDLLK